MSYFDAIIIAVVEGITEFLPISSTGHMIVVSDLLGLVQDPIVTRFEIIIQCGAIAAVVFYYRHDFGRAVRLWQQILIAFLPIAVVGFLSAKIISELFSVRIVAWAFILGGVVFLLVERWYGKRGTQSSAHTHDIDHMTNRQALGVGVAQVCSLIPGTSRSGATMIGGMLCGLSRSGATQFSFFVAVPVLLSVAGYEIVTQYDAIFAGDVSVLLLGLLISFIVAYGSIMFLVRFVATHRLVGFGIYRIIFGIILLLFFV